MSGQRATRADGLAVLAAKSLDAQLAQGATAELLAAPVQMPGPPEAAWEEQGVSGMGTGCFQQR